MAQARVLRNNALILDAALDAAAEDGWAGLALIAVARRAGLSQRPVADRFTDRSDLAVSVWRERAGPALQAALEQAQEAAGLLDGKGSPDAFVDSMLQLAAPGVALRGALELLIMSSFDPALSAEIEAGFAARVREWCTPRTGHLTRAAAARRAYLLIVALGLVAVARRPGADEVDLTGEFESLARALASRTSPRALPRAHLPHLEDDIPFATGDDIHDALLTSVLRLVSAMGFDGASTARIARDARVAEANIFLRHQSKLALFMDASARHQAYGFPANASFQQQLEAQHGPGIAEAVMIRELLGPRVKRQRTLNLEELRVSWHHQELLDRQEAQFLSFVEQQQAASPDWSGTASAARVHIGLATGFGVPLLGILDADAGTLPFDVVTVPLLDDPGAHESLTRP